MKHELPKLNYSYDALEPYIDAQTMEIHHSKHHQGYTDKFNTAIEGIDGLQELTVEEILMDLEQIPSDAKKAVVNNGGGYYNHSLFWEIMAPNAGGEPSEELLEAIESSFGSFEEFKEQFTKAASTRFGSGWAWLVVDGGMLNIISTANQDCPLSQGYVPILCLDVWEHAYYLKYQNKRPEYIENFFNVINWNKVEELYKKAI